LSQPLFNTVHILYYCQSASLMKEIILLQHWRTFSTSARCSKLLGTQQCLNSTGLLLWKSDML